MHTESTADQQAREEIRQQANSINNIAHDFIHMYVKLENLRLPVWLLQSFSDHYRELSGQELVAEMVYSFLLPEVEKETMRRRGTHNVY